MKELEEIIFEGLEEENMPLDFIYLSIMESKLEGKAVSTSNAVGYWQMKIPVAKEMGMVIDHEVDERMDIIASTSGASKYLKRNYIGYEKNWFKAALGYQMGFGGAKRFFEKNEFLKNNIVTANTPAYILKLIAHKIAFSEDLIPTDQVKLIVINVPPNTSVNTIAEEQEVSTNEIYLYNPWLKNSHTPKNRNVKMIIPK
jgi:membrane-bound lytic murein transglycosylase D